MRLMDTDRFFVGAGKASTILVVVIALVAAGAVALNKLGADGRGHRGTVEVAKSPEANDKVLLEFGATERVQGAGIQMVRLNSSARSEQYSYKSGRADTRNLLFVSDQGPGSRWLFKDHKGLIVSVAQLRQPAFPENDALPAKAIYVEFILQDSNGDGTLSDDDHATVGFARPDGAGFVAVLSGVARVLSQDMIDPARITVVFQRDNRIRRANIALDGFTLLSDDEIASVPRSLQP